MGLTTSARQQEIDKGRVLFQNNLYATAVGLCGNNDTNYDQGPSAKLHLPACQWIQDNLLAGNRRLLIMFPRGHLKTSVFTSSIPVWTWISDPGFRWLIMHQNSTRAEEMNGDIQNSLRAEEFRNYFGELIPNTKKPLANGKMVRWTHAETEINRPRWHRQPNLTALGMESTLETIHVHGIILDDPVGRKTANSPDLTSKAMEFIDHLSPLLESPGKGIVIIIGTWWPGGFYEKIAAKPAFKKLILGCYQDERSAAIGLTEFGKPIWPERFSPRELAKIREEDGEYMFSHQYLNVPLSRSSARFQIDDIKVYTLDRGAKTCNFIDNTGTRFKTPIADCDVSITCDPSSGGDDFAITVLAHHPETMNLFLLDWFAEPVNARIGLTKLYNLCERWGVWRAGMEWSDAQLLAEQYLKAIGIRKGRQVHLIKLRPGNRAKSERIIEGFQPFVESKRFHVVEGRDDRVVRQMLNWNPEAHDQRDDIIDSLAYHKDLLILRRGKRKGAETEPQDIKEDRRAMLSGSKLTKNTRAMYGLRCGRRTR